MCLPVGDASDRGTHHTSEAFAAVCRKQGVRRSVGRVRSSYGNALAESLFAGIKRELLHGERWFKKTAARMGPDRVRTKVAHLT